MGKRITTVQPKWMAADPTPYLEPRRFHELEIPVWVGEVALDKIQGWIGNPRTEMHAEQFRATYGRVPNNEEMYEIVLADDDPGEGLKIRELAGHIYKNGVRVPIVLTYNGKLLDGNRRYYACMFLTNEGAPKEDRKRFSQIPALILPEGTSSEIEDAIITEFNFASDFRLEWKYYVKATRVFNDYIEKDMDKEDLEKKYGVPWRYLTKWIQAAELCNRFLDYHGRQYTTIKFAHDNFIMFDEMMRNYGKKLKVQADFRKAVFDVLLSGYEDENPKFTKSDDVIRLDDIWNDSDAWNALVSKKGPQALKEALDILEISNLGSAPDPNPALRRVVKGLEKLVDTGALTLADGDLLEEFHRQSGQVPGAPNDPAAQVEKMLEWLDAMTSRQIEELEPQSISNLQKALGRVIKMSEVVSNVKTAKQSKK